MEARCYTSKSHYTPYMVRNELHESDLPLAPLLYCDTANVVVACPYCPMTHMHNMIGRSGVFASAHCCKGDYKFGDLLTGEEIRRLLNRNTKVVATKKLYKEKTKNKQKKVVEE